MVYIHYINYIYKIKRLQMFKGNQDSSDSQNQLDSISFIQKSLIIDPMISVDHLICSICFHIVWDPVICGSPIGCHNAFCRSCINSWIQKSNKLCPTCKKSFMHCDIPPILRSVLQGLIILCPNHVFGCQKKLKYLEFANHTRLCQFKTLKCKGCKNNIIQRDLVSHIENCDQFIIQCPKCRLKMTKAAMNAHSRVQCFSKQINKIGNRITCIEQNIEQINNSLQKLQSLTSCFLSGQALQMNIELYTTFNQHFIFPNPTLIKPSFNQQKEKFDFLHFYVLNPIYTDSIASIKWGIKINKMIGNILVGFCSSMSVNSLDYVINKYGDVKRKNNNQSKYKLVRKNDNGFGFGCGDVIKFKYVSLYKCIRIWNQTKRLGMTLGQQEISELGEKVFTFYSMDTLNDSLSFI